MGALANLYLMATRWVDFTQPVLNLVFRLYMAKVFFAAGLTKIQTWDSTLMLFQYEYSVPLIPYNIAAYMATAAEILLPILLVIGLGTRISAAGLFILNIVAAISYPDISPAGVNDHYFWGTMLLVLCIYGPGKISLDNWIHKRFFANS